MNLDIAIWKIIPDASYHSNGDGTIVWQDARPQPTQFQLEAAWHDYLNNDLKQTYDQAIQDYYAQLAATYVNEGKAMRYQAKQLEIVQFDKGEREPSRLPFMEKRRLVLEAKRGQPQTLQDARDNWQAAINAGTQGLAEIEYREELYRAQLAAMNVTSEQQLIDWLQNLGIEHP